MSKKIIALLFVLVLSPVIVYFLWPSEEARVRKLISATAQAAESEDLDGVMSAISYNYSDEAGLSYLVLKRVLKDRFAAYSDINVQYVGARVRVDGERAEADLNLRVIATRGGVRGYWLGDLTEPVELKIKLKKSGPLGSWQVVWSSGYM